MSGEDAVGKSEGMTPKTGSSEDAELGCSRASFCVRAQPCPVRPGPHSQGAGDWETQRMITAAGVAHLVLELLGAQTPTWAVRRQGRSQLWEQREQWCLGSPSPGSAFSASVCAC